MGRLQRRKEAHGTITRYVFDALGRRTQTKIGTNDEDEAGADDMVTTELLEYDSNADDGNGYLTKRTLRVQDSATDERVTTYDHDVRGNVIVVTNATAPHILYKRDNLGRVTAVGSYSSSTGLDTSDDPTSLATNRMALTETFFNQRGQVWKIERHKIDPADGSDDGNLRTRTWYDAEGRVIMVDGESLTKTVYDRLGRVTHRFTLANDDDTLYAHAANVTGDVVLVEEQTVYESSDSDDVLMRATISRFHDDEATPTGALDSNADGDDLLITAANLGGRPEITAMWYDDLGRVTDSVTYGNNDTDADGDSDDFDRDGLSAPTRSDTKLRTTFAYYDDGGRKSVTDPRDLETRFEYDDAGRQTAVIRNYVDGTPSSSTGDDDVFTRTVYTNGLRTKLWVDFDGDDVEDTGDQVTTYTFGTTKGASAGDSEIGTGHLLQKVQYPDSSGGTDVVTYAYNAQSQEIWRRDQVGYVLEKDYDDSGRLEHDRATNAGSVSGLDEDVLRITYGYDGLGRRETITQYDNATVGSGSVLDEVKYTYNGWSLITSVEQDNNSTVATGGDNYYQITYDYEKNTTGRNTIRLKEIVLPSGAGYALKYSSASGKIDDDASRVTSILEGLPPAFQTVLVTYEYLGASQLVATTYDTEDIKRELFGTTSGIYDALDNFDRVIEDKWVKDLATDVSIYEVDLTYDRNSNITLVDEIGPHVGFDVAYTMDGLDRLTDAQQGTWNGSSITTETSQQVWVLDQVGNWEDVTLDFNDDNVYTGTDEYDDDRVHNDVNELTSRDIDDDETADYTLSYDAAGNLTDDGESYKYEYDVWYRLRKVNDQSDNLVAEYRYNGLRHRIAEHADTDDDQDVDANDDWHHFANDERWRVVAMFVDTDTAPTEEFVHDAAGNSGGSSYIDQVALRDRDTDANGSLDERIWYLQNWRYDVVALVDDGGDQREMVRYSSYGVPFGVPGGDADSDGDNDATDATQVQSWIDAASYDARGDVDLDGDVDSTDKTRVSSAPLSGLTSGAAMLTAFGNTRGYAGYLQTTAHRGWEVRNRFLDGATGRWQKRDPLEYVESPNLYAYVMSRPITRLDPMGLLGECLADGSSGKDSSSYPVMHAKVTSVQNGSCDNDDWDLGTGAKQQSKPCRISWEITVDCSLCFPCRLSDERFGVLKTLKGPGTIVYQERHTLRCTDDPGNMSATYIGMCYLAGVISIDTITVTSTCSACD